MLFSWDYGLAIVNTISQLLHSTFQSAADGLATDNFSWILTMVHMLYHSEIENDRT